MDLHECLSLMTTLAEDSLHTQGWVVCVTSEYSYILVLTRIDPTPPPRTYPLVLSQGFTQSWSKVYSRQPAT